VVSMGPAPAGSNASGWSVELCGGTHVARTGDIGLVTIVGEGAVAAGVRRVEAMTADGARRHLAEQARRLESVAGLVKTSVGDVEARVEALVEERRRLERELSEAKKKLAMGGGAGAADPVKTVGSVRLLAKSVTGVEMRDLKGLADAGKAQVGSGVVAIVGVSEDGKAGIVVGVTPDLTGRLNAVDLVKLGSEALGGKGGGGRPDMAQAGGPDGTKADEALAAIEAALAAA
jgi:alanyl-tRNA synthetase